MALFRRILTALLSGQKSAYFGAFVLAAGPLARLVDKLLLVRIMGNQDCDSGGSLPQVLLIVGAPRSGTTLVYQMLVNLIPTIYYSNLHALFPATASAILKKNPGPCKSVKNYYGYSYGFSGVNEGNMVLQKIYGDGHNTDEIRERFIDFVQSMHAEPGQPIIIKNVYSYDKLEVLLKINPEIKVLLVQRDKLQTAQSILRAYKELGYFAPIPACLKGKLPIIGPHEFTVMLLCEMQKEFQQQRKLAGENRWLEIQYEDFCRNSESISVQIAEFIGVPAARVRRGEVQKLQASRVQKVTDEDIEKLNNALQKHYKCPSEITDSRSRCVS